MFMFDVLGKTYIYMHCNCAVDVESSHDRRLSSIEIAYGVGAPIESVVFMRVIDEEGVRVVWT